MKKTKILTVLGVLLAMGITACGGKKTPSSSEQPAPSSNSAAPSTSEPGTSEPGTSAPDSSAPAQSSSNTPASSSTPAPSSSSASSSVDPGPQKDATGHIWGADADVEASNGGVAYKLAECSEGDDFKKITVNQSNVTLASGSSRKAGTPDGYLKLDSNGNSCSFKFNYDSYAVGKLFLYSCMDGWSSNYSKNAFYYQGSPNIEIKVNGKAMDLTALADVIYTDFLPGDTEASYSEDGYGLIGDIVIHEGLNEISYKRVQTMNTLVKDFVLVIKDEEHTHEFSDWANEKAPTCTDIGSQTRSCACGIVEQNDVNSLPHDLDEETEVEKRNSDGKKVFQYDCKAGNEKVAAIAMNQISGVYNTTAVEGEKEKWTIGADANKAAADTYKMDKGTALLFKVGVSKDVDNAFISVGAKFSNPLARHFYNERDYTDSFTNGDKPDAEDAFRYYTKVNDGEFEPIGINCLMSDVFGDGSEVRYMPLGKFNLKAGENLIYLRQGNIGYRVTLEGNLYIALNGDATVSGDSPTHSHQAATEWSYDENNHWHACAGADCDEPTWKDSEAAHTFGDPYDEVPATCEAKGSYKIKCSVCEYVKTVETDKVAHTFGDWSEASPATCEAAGSEERECSVCGEKETRIVAKLAHDFGDVVANNAAADDCVATTVRNCSLCEKSSLRWNATDYDATKTTARSDAGPESRSSGQAIRFSSTPNYSGGDVTKKGCHIVYNVNIAEDVTNIGLSFLTSMRNDISTIFDKSESDSSQGYEYVNEELVRPDSRYGLKVDGNVILVEKDLTGQTWKTGNNWYDFPVTIPSLTAGAHEIEIYNLGGYRADIYEFQLTGLPKVEATHTHTTNGEWSSDDNNHWHVCTGEDCPAANGIVDLGAHDWDDGVVTTAATHTAEGVKTYTCQTCGKTKTETIAKVAHAWVDGTPGNNSDGFAVTPMSCDCGKVGAKMAVASFTGNTSTATDYKHANGTVITYKIIAPKAGNYELKIGAFVSQNRTKDLSSTPYTVKVGDTDVAVSSGTYEQLGIGTNSGKQFTLCPLIALEAGENVITISQGSGGYRLTFQGLVEIIEL